MVQLDEWIEGKKVLILGFGREGQSTCRVLRAFGGYKELAIADQADGKGRCPDKGISWISGPHYQQAMDNYDVVFKSPGIVLERPLKAYRCRIVSQTEIFVRMFRRQIIGVTGTKGKSTTATLLYHVLKEAGKKVILVGNIGIPAFDHMEEIEEDTVIVFELSCHQLEYLTVSPYMALLLNIHEEHLDHYGTMEKYIRAKENIFRHQEEQDVLICHRQCFPENQACCSEKFMVQEVQDSALLCGGGQKASIDRDEQNWMGGEEQEIILNGKCICFRDEHFIIPVDEIQLLGQHNYLDIAFVYAACRLKGVNQKQFAQGLKTYQPLPHRLAFLGVHRGVKYYDDSISTICETAIQALQTIKDADTILIGGMDRGIDYRELIVYLSESTVSHILLMEATGKRIYKEIFRDYPGFKRAERLVLTEHLQEAVREAKRLTQPGKSCVLSPAAASYGIFTNFEERGDVFQALVFADDVR
ncbi:MAG: UDP-N-acetylmuramoyl-L-alanine--D-glutamate ligase [Lachnospiraceae bacterium]|nr:UDP-N-acetylmuramoyl-L-alanine--D-glutamate ligase [Lachnospiraceae bacterium]